MMVLEIGDILFFVKCLKEPSAHFNIFSFITFCSGQTRPALHFKLRHTRPISNNSIRHFYFNRLPHLWNSLPLLNLDHSLSTIRSKLYKLFCIKNFNLDNPYSFHYPCPCAKCSSIPTLTPLSCLSMFVFVLLFVIGCWCIPPADPQHYHPIAIILPLTFHLPCVW